MYILILCCIPKWTWQLCKFLLRYKASMPMLVTVMVMSHCDQIVISLKLSVEGRKQRRRCLRIGGRIWAHPFELPCAPDLPGCHKAPISVYRFEQRGVDRCTCGHVKISPGYWYTQSIAHLMYAMSSAITWRGSPVMMVGVAKLCAFKYPICVQKIKCDVWRPFSAAQQVTQSKCANHIRGDAS